MLAVPRAGQTAPGLSSGPDGLTFAEPRQAQPDDAPCRFA